MNIAETLVRSARLWPLQRAVMCPAGRDRSGRVRYSQVTFRELDDDSGRLAAGLRRMGVGAGSRMVLMVRPGIEFVSLTYALFKAGAVVVLIDPGMGLRNSLKCLAEIEPDGFVALPAVHAVRILSRMFRTSKLNVTLGRRWFWGGPTVEQLRRQNQPERASVRFDFEPAFTSLPRAATDPAAVLFTSGSTGPAKGVVYEHGMFAAQVDALRDYFGIQPGEVDLPGFPLFALFNAAMGVTTVIPEMDPSRPARVDPARIVEAIRQQGVTQAFGSPAIWDRVGRYCEQAGLRLPSLKRVMSAGAPVPEHVLRRMSAALVETPGEPWPEMHTPYGATEALPVAAITAREVLHRTAPKTRAGAGTCVGRLFPGVRVRIVPVTDGPIESLVDVGELPAGEIGEILVQGPAVTREYYRKPEATRAAKVPDGDRFWHRMGDVGYVDGEGLVWFCGRKSHIVETARGRMYTECVEPLFNIRPQVSRTALVGVGTPPNQTPVLVVETAPEAHVEALSRDLLAVGEPLRIELFLFHPSLPVDIRHNVKINREALATWAEEQVSSRERYRPEDRPP